MLRRGLAWTASILLASPTALAQQAEITRPRVVVLADPGTAREQNRISGDLQARGYEVVSMQATPSDDRAATAESTRRMDAVAALRVRDGGLIEIWIAGPSHGRSTMRDLVAPFSSADDARSDAVVHALELLRAHLIQIRAPDNLPVETHAPERPRATMPQHGHCTSAVPGRFAAAAGAGVMHATGGVGSAVGVTVQVRIAAAPVWGVALDAFLPVRSGSLNRPEASANVTPWLAGGSVWIAPWSGPLRPHAEAGLSLSLLSMSAEANPGFIGRSQRLLAGVGYVGMGLSLKLNTDVAIRVDGLAGRVFPSERLRFVEKETARWGPYLLSASAGLEWRF